MPEFFIFSLGFMALVFTSWKQAKEKLFSERVLFDAVLLTVLGALIGARTIYILFHTGQFGLNILKWIVVGLYPGFSPAGALLGASAVWWLLSDKKTLVPFPELIDVLTRSYLLVAPFILFILFFVSPELGNELEISLPIFGTTHAVTLYKFIAVIVVICLTRFLFVKKRKLASGTFSAVVWLFLILCFFFIDFFKQCDVYYWKLCVDQWIYSILMIVISVILLFQIKQKDFFSKGKL
jgi:prolipoprotein diacylglyceryltransferase